jgi:hypothetical protein
MALRPGLLNRNEAFNQIEKGKIGAAFICTPLSLQIAAGLFAQTAQNISPESPREAGTSNDLSVMFGSDLVRPSLLPKANYNVGLDHTFKFLKENPIGDE